MFNLDSLLTRFRIVHSFLYAADCSTCGANYFPGYYDVVEEFNLIASRYNKLVCDFIDLRMDFISSDREAAAFTLALQSFKEFKPRNKRLYYIVPYSVDGQHGSEIIELPLTKQQFKDWYSSRNAAGAIFDSYAGACYYIDD